MIFSKVKMQNLLFTMPSSFWFSQDHLRLRLRDTQSLLRKIIEGNDLYDFHFTTFFHLLRSVRTAKNWIYRALMILPRLWQNLFSLIKSIRKYYTPHRPAIQGTNHYDFITPWISSQVWSVLGSIDGPCCSRISVEIRWHTYFSNDTLVKQQHHRNFCFSNGEKNNRFLCACAYFELRTEDCFLNHITLK